MSNRSQDTASSIFSVAEDLAEAMNVASTIGRSFAKLVKPTEIEKPSFVSGKIANAQSKLTPNLSPVHQANSAEEMAILLSPLISECFTLGKSATKKLRIQLGLYFKSMGITDELCLGMRMDHAIWAVPDLFATDTEALEQLMVPVILLLTKLATYSLQLRKEYLYLCTGVLLADLSTWYDRYVKKEAKKEPNAIKDPISIPKLI